MSQQEEDTSMWIAPCRHTADGKKNWSVNDWKALDLNSQEGWNTAIEIFEDRITYRYLDAIETLQKADNAHYRETGQRQFGFAMMGLACLLIETLAQTYAGLEESPGRNKNGEFYADFLTQNSLVLKSAFDEISAKRFYKTIRCGILHQAETKKKTTLRFIKSTDRTCVVEVLEDGDSLCIYWKNFYSLLREELKAYFEDLKEKRTEQIAVNFIQKMNFICDER